MQGHFPPPAKVTTLRRAHLSLVLLAVGVAGLSALEPQALSVVQAGPIGEIRQLQDANEIRVVFSQPMVALGRIPANPRPPWIRLTPAAPGRWRWSGTTTLIFTPDPAAPLPYATRYTVTVDAAAESAAGQALGTPYEFSFTTPTVRLTSARWRRQGDRFDRPLALALEFNQPVRPADVVAHVTARYRRHDFGPPTLTGAERARMMGEDPMGVRRFDEKVAAARQAAARTDAVPLRLATSWDRKAFPPSDTLAVLETVTAPPPGTQIDITVDASMPSPQGRETPPAAQSSLVEPDPVFFVRRPLCRSGCDPSGYNGIEFTGEVQASGFAAALSITDVTEPTREARVERASPVPSSTLDTSTVHGLDEAGFDPQPPARTWALRLESSLTAVDGQTLGYPWIGIIENWHEQAFTSFGDGHGVWETSGGRTLPFYARNYQSVTQHMTPLDARDLMPRLVELEKANFEVQPSGAGTPRRLDVTPDKIQSHGLDVSSVLSRAGTGLAWVGLTPGDPIERSRAVPRTTSTVVQMTNLGITVKDSPHSTLVFVTALDTANPVADARVTIVNTNNQEVWQGTTNRDGVALAPALPLRSPDRWWEFSFLVLAEKGGDIAYVGSNWNEGIQPWDFDVGFGLWESTDILRGSVFSDRGVYKPGEEVHVKAIVRLDTPDGVRLLPAGSTVDVRVNDARGREVDARQVTVSRWSSAEWTWTIPAEGALGNYRVDVSLPGTNRPETNDVTEPSRQPDWLRRVGGSFLVAAYRKPDFRVDTRLDAGDAVAGTTLKGKVEARYLFGSVVARRPVRWSIVRSPDSTVPAAVLDRFPPDRYAFGYWPENARHEGERVAGADATLDAQGRFEVDLPTDTGTDLTYRYTFEADVEDVSRQHIAGRSASIVYPAPWHVGLGRPDYFADVQRGTSVDVVAVDREGNPVAGVDVRLRLVRIQWNSVRHAEGSGFYRWETERVELPAGEWTVTTAAKPVTVTIPLSEGGSYQIQAEAADGGRRTRTDASFYALGRGYTAWRRFDHNRIEIEPERPTWKPGERARIMIQSPWESATALVTLEREGIRRFERFALTSTQQTVEVPISEAEIPNVFVSVLLVRGRTSDDPGEDGSDPGKPAFRLGYTELVVEDARKRLNVGVTADREEYRPANSARVRVAVHDVDGRPARSEVTLWAVDYGVLSLTGYDPPDVLSAVYRRKALQVLTEDSRQRIISRRVLTPKGESSGGGGGMENVRTDLRPLAFWLGSVETGEDGTAVRDVALPESLTTYRIMAVAADAASRFGSDSAEIRVTKPLSLLAAFPRFLMPGDQASLGAVVTNTRPEGGAAVVTIESLDPAVLRFPAGTRVTVQLGGGTTEAVRFGAVAMSVGVARVRVTARRGDDSDAFESTLRVLAPARPEVMAAFGDTDARSVERLAVPDGLVSSVGRLDVSLASTALVGLGEGARYLADYPYFCAEQKASSALALVLAADLGSVFSMSRIAPGDYRLRAEALLNDLPRYQCEDGGFGSWPGRCFHGQVYLTSYVLHVMHVARGLSIEPDSQVVSRALDFLDVRVRDAGPQQVQWLPAWSAGQAFGVKVLTEYGRNQDSNITRLSGMVDRMPIFALSYLADAVAAASRPDPRYPDLVRRITNAMRIEGDRAHVEELDEEALAFLWNSNVRSTALVLEGLARRGDDPIFVQRAVRWLLAARRNGRWRNTQENATALHALVTYYRKFEAEPPDMSATVTLGGRTIGSARFAGRSTAAQTVTLAMPDLLRQVAAGAEAELAVSRAGTGRLYYTARLEYVSASAPAPAEEGIRVERRYERFVEDGESPPATTFDAGDLIRVTLAVTLPTERRFVAVTDAMPAGVEAVDGWFRTTASDLARDASQQSADESWDAWWRRGGFDHVEKYDDRVELFATRLSAGRHEFSYLVRATTSGTFAAPGTWAEEMYAPEVHGRAPAATVVIR